jgi:flagellar protein FliS
VSTVNPYNQYRQTQIQTAPPEQLVLMLYDGAIRFALQSIESINAKDPEAANNWLIRVQDIVSELRTALDSRAGEVATQLDFLYDYLYRRTVEANVKKDVEIVEEVVHFLRELRSTWAEAIQIARQQQLRYGVGDGGSNF